MSVIARRHSIPKQRSAKGAVDLGVPAPLPRVAAPSSTGPSRRRIAALVAGLALVSAGAGTGAYVVLDDAPAATTTVEIPSREVSRDAATARRGVDAASQRLDARLASEAKRDAAAASRAASVVRPAGP